MSALDALSAAAGLDMELGDEGNDGRQIGLVLHDDLGIDQFHVALRAHAARDVEGAVDLFRSGNGPQLGLVPWMSPGLFLASFQLAAAEVPGLTVRLAACVIEFLAEAVVVLFQLGQAVLLAAVVVCHLVKLIPQARQLALTQPTATAVSDRRKHGKPRLTLFERPFTARCLVEVYLHGRSPVKRPTRPKVAPDQAPTKDMPESRTATERKTQIQRTVNKNGK